MAVLLAIFLTIWALGFVLMLIVGFIGNRQIKKGPNVTKGLIVKNWVLTFLWACIPVAGLAIAIYIGSYMAAESDWWNSPA